MTTIKITVESEDEKVNSIIALLLTKTLLDTNLDAVCSVEDVINAPSTLMRVFDYEGLLQGKGPVLIASKLLTIGGRLRTERTIEEVKHILNEKGK